MKTLSKAATRFLALLAVCLAPTAPAQSTVPTITQIRTKGTNCVLTACIPAGMQRITLETAKRCKSPGWAPRAVVRPNATAGLITFRLPLSRPMELIRVRADTSEPLPATFYQGTNAFSAPTDSSVNWTLDGPITTAGPGAPPNAPGPRDVVESDIWQLQGPLCWWWPDLAHADGSLAEGLWIPFGAYGATHILTSP